MATQQLVPVTVMAKVTTTVTDTAPTFKDLYPKTTVPPLREALVPAPPPKNMVPLVYEVDFRKIMVLQGQEVCPKSMARQVQETACPKSMVLPGLEVVSLRNMAHHQLEDYPKSTELPLLEV